MPRAGESGASSSGAASAETTSLRRGRERNGPAGSCRLWASGRQSWPPTSKVRSQPLSVFLDEGCRMKSFGWIAGASLAAATIATGIALGAGGTVNVAYAGSLVAAFENAIGPAFAKRGFEYRGEGKGSVALANLIKDGPRTPDVFVSADTKVLDDLMKPTHDGPVRWYVPFGSARLVVAYAPSSP